MATGLNAETSMASAEEEPPGRTDISKEPDDEPPGKIAESWRRLFAHIPKADWDN